MNIHLYVHHVENGKLDEILGILRSLQNQGVRDMSKLDDAIDALTAKVTAMKTVADSTAAFINGVPGLIATAVQAATAAGATPAQLKAFTDLGTALQDSSDEISAAMTANTSAAPSP